MVLRIASGIALPESMLATKEVWLPESIPLLLAVGALRRCVWLVGFGLSELSLIVVILGTA